MPRGASTHWLTDAPTPHPTPSSTPSPQWLWITPHRCSFSAQSSQVQNHAHPLSPPHPTTTDAVMRPYPVTRRETPGLALLEASSTQRTTELRSLWYCWLERRRLELRGSIYPRIFFNKYSWPFLSTDFTSIGFVSADSTDSRLKTVFSHSQPRIPNCRFPDIVLDLQLAQYAVALKSVLYSRKLYADFPLCRVWDTLTPVLFKAQLYSIRIINVRSCPIYPRNRSNITSFIKYCGDPVITLLRKHSLSIIPMNLILFNKYPRSSLIPYQPTFWDDTPLFPYHIH